MQDQTNSKWKTALSILSLAMGTSAALLSLLGRPCWGFALAAGIYGYLAGRE